VAGRAGRKLLHLVPVLLLVSLATLLLLNLTPGDPAYALLSDQATPEQVAAVHKQLGLDRPFIVRYAAWLGGIAHGDFGTSFRTHQPVADAIKERLPVTSELAFLALVIALAAAVPLGVYAAYRADGAFDRTLSLATSVFISSPAFLTGLFLTYVLAVSLRVLPVTGWVNLLDDPLGNLDHILLPALTLSLGEVAIFTRLLRSDMIGTLQEDFILAAKAKGLPIGRILVRHALRPSSFSLVTLAGISLGRLMAGAVIVESLFALPGLGQLVIQAVLSRDYIVVQGVVMFVALAYVLINTLVDIAYGYLDPRVRASGA
jgi:peptide/nickel transport system permease protein